MANQLTPPSPIHYISLEDAKTAVNALRSEIKGNSAKLITVGELKSRFAGRTRQNHMLRTDLAQLLANEKAARRVTKGETRAIKSPTFIRHSPKKK